MQNSEFGWAAPYTNSMQDLAGLPYDLSWSQNTFENDVYFGIVPDSMDCEPHLLPPVGRNLGNARQPLHQAAQGGHKDVVQLLLKHGAPADVYEVDGVTPLWLAAQDGHWEIVELLHAAGADLNVTDRKWGRQPIHQAASNGHTRVAQSLLTHGAEPDRAAKDGETPLWLAASKGDSTTVAALLALSARMDAAIIESHRETSEQDTQSDHNGLGAATTE